MAYFQRDRGSLTGSVVGYGVQLIPSPNGRVRVYFHIIIVAIY